MAICEECKKEIAIVISDKRALCLDCYKEEVKDGGRRREDQKRNGGSEDEGR